MKQFSHLQTMNVCLLSQKRIFLFLVKVYYGYVLNDSGKFCTYLSTVKQKKSVNMFVLSWALTSVCHIMNYVISDFSP